MTVHLHWFLWFLPTGCDGRTLVDRHAYAPNRAGAARTVRGVRPPDIEYLAHIAKGRAVGLRVGPHTDGYLVRERLADHGGTRQHTERLKFSRTTSTASTTRSRAG